MSPDRAFRVPASVAGEAARIAAARAEGRLPDVLVDGRLIGDGPAEALEPVDVTAGELAQLLEGRRLPRWVAAKNPLSGGYVATKALMR